jgi:hypothetical protein
VPGHDLDFNESAPLLFTKYPPLCFKLLHDIKCYSNSLLKELRFQMSTVLTILTLPVLANEEQMEADGSHLLQVNEAQILESQSTYY